MTIDSASGLVHWNPTLSQTGLQPCTIRVSDNRGGFDEQSFTINVTQASGEIRGAKFNDLDGDGQWATSDDVIVTGINLVQKEDSKTDSSAAIPITFIRQGEMLTKELGG